MFSLYLKGLLKGELTVLLTYNTIFFFGHLTDPGDSEPFPVAPVSVSGCSCGRYPGTILLYRAEQWRKSTGEMQKDS